ncbi:MAG: type IV pilus assembly protein PilM [Pirellulales bacterium]|nr:type IV pilus assembly protein PilM [Pirellulales bacterium]
MARSKAVWGIDLGQSALKALRCRLGDDADSIVADAFDYIEYPKILSQPEANPEELIAEAIKTFLSRNSVRGDRVAISVSGQSGLARFIKLPPVESKKIPDIVKYEAKQQIPFGLEDVVWDYQQMAGGSVEEGFALETEVGLFAMKREQVFRALAPFTEAGIEVDYVQLAPLALYNFVAFDQMPDLPPPEDYDPENPPGSVVVLSVGTDTTDLVITNGFRVWQRNVPLGGNHFTRALTKELKLTFASAEHQKRNVAQAGEGGKAVFQAMRSVFNDLLNQVQMSLKYYGDIDRRTKVVRVLALGNTLKLPGLQRYLQQNLGMDVARLEKFRTLGGSEVVDASAFKDNILTFATCYGLALQGLRDTKIRTNLLPPEIAQERMIRNKKPWALAAAAVLLLGFTLSALGHWRAWGSAKMNGYFQAAVDEAKSTATTAQRYSSEFGESKGAYETTIGIGERLTHSSDGRTEWLRTMKAINAAVPRDPKSADLPLDRIAEREELQITQIECAEVTGLEAWFGGVQRFRPLPPPRAKPEPGAEGEEVAPEEAPSEEGTEGEEFALPPGVEAPSGAGWVFQIRGYHYHNSGNPDNEGAQYVRKTLLTNLAEMKLQLPGEEKELSMAERGIMFPVLINPGTIVETTLDVNEGAPPGHAANVPAKVRRYDFLVQFMWKPKQAEGEEAQGEAEF